MRKNGIISVAVLFTLLVTVFTGCSNSSSPASDEQLEYSIYEDSLMGLTLELPTEELADWTVIYGPFDQSIDRGEYAPVDGSSLSFMPMESGVDLFFIQYYEETELDTWLNSGIKLDEITGVAGSEEIGTSNGMVYIYSCPAPDDSGMDSTTKDAYKRILNMLSKIKDSITLTIPPASNTGALPDFQTTDLFGNAVDSTLFASNKITMLNIWGTFCSPCIEEMPDLAAMSENMPDGTTIIGLVTDALDAEKIELAKSIVADTGVNYINIIPDSALSGYIDEYVTGVPTTLFIDKTGNIVGNAIIGKQGVDVYMDALTTHLLDAGSSQPQQNGIGASTVPESGGTSNIPENGESAQSGRGAAISGLLDLIDLSGTVKFAAKTAYGDAIDSSFFSGYDITMINIWGTLCKPCIEEMPDIQRLYTEMEPQGVNIIGFVANPEDDRVEKAQEILTKLKITYPNVIFDDDTSTSICAQISGFPTTIFVDSTGRIIGQQVSGANNYDKYKTLIEERMKMAGR
jgi:thiol-disulfide isomerase/thioredoxin